MRTQILIFLGSLLIVGAIYSCSNGSATPNAPNVVQSEVLEHPDGIPCISEPFQVRVIQDGDTTHLCTDNVRTAISLANGYLEHPYGEGKLSIKVTHHVSKKTGSRLKNGTPVYSLNRTVYPWIEN